MTKSVGKIRKSAAISRKKSAIGEHGKSVGKAVHKRAEKEERQYQKAYKSASSASKPSSPTHKRHMSKKGSSLIK